MTSLQLMFTKPSFECWVHFTASPLNLTKHALYTSLHRRPFETGVLRKQCDISSHINLWGHHRIPQINICIFFLEIRSTNTSGMSSLVAWSSGSLSLTSRKCCRKTMCCLIQEVLRACYAKFSGVHWSIFTCVSVKSHQDLIQLATYGVHP